MNNSNFYMKAKLMGGGVPGDEIKIPVEDTVYTICPGCGKEHSMGLDELHELDLDCTVYCGDCPESDEALCKAKAVQPEESEAANASAFYVKGSDGGSVTKTPFTGTVFTTFNRCGAEMEVEIIEAVRNLCTGADIFEVSDPLLGDWMCDKCTAQELRAITDHST